MRLLLLVLAIAMGFAALRLVVLWGSWAMQQDRRPKLGRADVALFFRELVSTAAFDLLTPLGLLEAGPRAAPASSPARSAVLLVPDTGRNRASLFPLAFFLRRRGHAWVWPINRRPASAPLHEQAWHLSRAVERLQLASGAPQVDLVCHGDAGLVAAWYLAHLGGHDNVRRFVTLGTPWSGTRTAIFRRGAVARDLAPGSDFLGRLGPIDVPDAALWSASSPAVQPGDSAWLAGATQLDRAGHAELLVSRRSWLLVQDALERA